MKSSLQYRALLDIFFAVLIFAASFSIAYKIISKKVENAKMFWSTSQFFESITLMNFAFGFVPGDFEYKAELSYEIPEIRFFTTNPSSARDIKAHCIIAGFYEEEAFNLLGCLKDIGMYIYATFAYLASLRDKYMGIVASSIFHFYYPKDLLYVIKDIRELFEDLKDTISGFFGGCECSSTISAVFFYGFNYDDNTYEITGDNLHQYFYPLMTPFFTYPLTDGNIVDAFKCENENANISAIESIGNNIYKLKESCLCKSSCNNAILFVQRKVRKIEVYRNQLGLLDFKIHSQFLT